MLWHTNTQLSYAKVATWLRDLHLLTMGPRTWNSSPTHPSPSQDSQRRELLYVIQGSGIWTAYQHWPRLSNINYNHKAFLVQRASQRDNEHRETFHYICMDERHSPSNFLAPIVTHMVFTRQELTWFTAFLHYQVILLHTHTLGYISSFKLQTCFNRYELYGAFKGSTRIH